MFNWFKNKLNNLVPSDIGKGFMSSTFTKIKIGQALTIPENVCCYLSYHDKIYAELETGTYTLDKALLEKIYNRQQKNNRPLKKLDLDLFFVNLNSQDLKFCFPDKIPVKKKTKKFQVQVTITLKPKSPRVITDFLCAEFYSINAENSKECYMEYSQEFLKKQLLKVELNSSLLPAETKEDLRTKLKEYLKNLGMELLSFDLQLFVNDDEKGRLTQGFDFQFQNFESNTPSKTVDQTQKFDYNENNSTPSNLCPKCKSKIIKGAVFCHRCGNTLK